MDNYWKTAGFILITVILGLAIGRTEKDISVLLTMTACCMAAVVAVSYLEPVFDLLWELCAAAEVQNSILRTLLKAVGIALVSELACTICTDAGNGSLGKTLQLLSSATILYISIPIFNTLLTLIREILAEL